MPEALITECSEAGVVSEIRRTIRSANSVTLGNVRSIAALCTSLRTSSSTLRTVETTAFRPSRSLSFRNGVAFEELVDRRDATEGVERHGHTTLSGGFPRGSASYFSSSLSPTWAGPAVSA